MEVERPADRAGDSSLCSKWHFRFLDRFGLSDEEKGKMMKDVFDCICKVMLSVVLCAIVFLGCGCQQKGETVAEGRRRHQRNLRLNQQQLVEDIDTVLLFDEPSKLGDKRIP